MQQSSASRRVLNVVAEAEGTQPSNLEPPLYEVIDPKAIDQLIQSGSNRGPASAPHVEFTYLEYRIRITDSGEITLTETSPRPQSD